MDALVVAMLTAAVLLNGAALLLALLPNLRRPHPVSTPADQSDPQTEPTPQQPAPRVPDDPNRMVVEPPMIDGVTLRAWLFHHHPLQDNVWRDVVIEFYNRAAQDPRVAPYFASTDMPVLRQHFTRTLAMVAGQGVRVGDVEYLRRAHAGRGITGEVWDAVVGTLVAILAEHGVPRRGIDALAATVTSARDIIVTA